jgi:hypothetical protein
MPVSRTAWQQSCTCPGTEEARRRLDEASEPPPDFAESRQRSQRERQAGKESRSEAFDAVHAVAAGKTREHIRDLYEAELRSRGLAVPPDRLLDAYAGVLAGNPPSKLLPVHFLAELSKDIDELVKLFRNVKVYREGD